MNNNIKQKLENYSIVKPQAIEGIKPGDKLRYMTNNEFRGGGVVKINKYPDYIVLLNPIKNVSWCMQLKDPTLSIWKKNIDKEALQKEKIFKLYQEGKLTKKK